MIKGIGIDLVNIKRIKKMHEKWGDAFLDKIYTSSEIAYCKTKARPYQHLAARFAIKEAAIKMLDKAEGLSWQDIEIENKASGKPELKLKRSARKAADLIGIKKVHISISHEKELAVAQVIGEGEFEK